MLISRTWLAELLDAPLPDDADLAELITGLGLEVEGVKRHGAALDRIVVGRVDGVQPHPDADKLCVVQLFDGNATRSVVCGAPNVPAAGGRVVFAPVGTTLPGGLEIGARKIRGVPSEGMICAEDELDIGPDHSGIIVLPSDWEPGDRLADCVPGVVDTVFELSITPNRPDALGHVGVARDLAVKLRCGLRLPTAEPTEAPSDASLVTIEAPDRCGRYLGHTYEDAKVGPSPLWLRVRLHRAGLRPINNVVDITNLVLMEWGQPLHAFDRDNLAEGRVVVRRATEGEPMSTLDEQKLALSSEDLVIADAKRPQALAGVMGGIDSGVEQHTTRLLLEAAWFSPIPIRRTARRHQLSTDSSYRFERGVDHASGLSHANDRARFLLETLTGAKCVGACEALGERPPIPTIELRPERTRLLLGMDVPVDEARRVLQGLQIEVDASDPARWRCRPPTHRPDLQREVDLIEELMRHHGLADLPSIASMPTAYPELDEERIAEARELYVHNTLADALVQAGLHEHLSFVFTREEALRPFADEISLDQAVRLANPMRVQAAVMRTHMLPGLLDALAVNVARHARGIRLFELGRIYYWGQRTPQGPTAEIDAQLPLEPQRAAILLSDGSGVQTDTSDVGARDVAGVLLSTLEKLGHRPALREAVEKQRATWLHPGVQASLWVQGDDDESCEVGLFGQVHPDLMDAWSLSDTRAYYGEIRVDALPRPRTAMYTEVPRFPSTSRDLSLEIPVDLPAARVVEALHAAASASQPEGDDPPRLAVGDQSREAIEVLEDYRGQGVASGARALLLRLHYRAARRSVTDAEVQAVHAQIVQQACDALRQRAPDIRPR